MDTFNFLFIPFFFGYCTEITKTDFFKISESLPFLFMNLKWRAKFQISRILISDSDWLNLIHFSGYKYKIRLVSRLRKKEDQALISISKILKFPALLSFDKVFISQSGVLISSEKNNDNKNKSPCPYFSVKINILYVNYNEHLKNFNVKLR